MSCSPSDRLVQTLTIEAPGVTDGMLKLALFNTMDEFYKRTNAWKHEQDITLEEDTYNYDVDIPNGSAVVRLMLVTHQGVPVPSATQQAAVTQSSVGTLLPELTFPDGDAAFLPAQTDMDPSGIFSYAVYRPNYISVTGVPDEQARTYPMRALWALTVAKGCLECECGDWDMMPEWHWDQFFQDWLDGTLGRLMSMPAKPWGNKEGAILHSKRFRNAMALRMQESRRGYVFAVPGWRFPRGWV